MSNGRLEAQITVPIAWTGTINDSGAGAAVSFSVPAGTYFLTELLAELETRLNTAATTDTIVVAVGSGELGTGRVTISGTGIFAIVWIATDLRDLLGYTANLSAATSYLAPNHARSLWIGGSPYRAPNEVVPWAGWPKADFRTVESAAGQVWAFSGQKKELAELSWDAVPRSRASKANEVLVNESFQRFIEDGVWGFAVWGTPAGPIRFFPNADLESYVEYYVTDLDEFIPSQFADGWAGGPWKVQLPRLVVKDTVQVEEEEEEEQLTPTPVHIETLAFAGNTTTYAFASATIDSDEVAFVGVNSAPNSATPVAPTSVGGTGITFDKIVEILDIETANPARCLSVWRARPSSNFSGVITATFGATQLGCCISLVKIQDADVSGTNGAGAVVQTDDVSGANAAVTTLTSTLAALQNAANLCLAFLATNAQGAITPSSGFTEPAGGEVNHGSPSSALEVEWLTGAVVCSPSWPSAKAGLVTIEVKGAPA